MPRNDEELAASTGSSSPMNGKRAPAERSEANSRSSATGKRRCSSTRRNSCPTRPVAPRIATRNALIALSPSGRASASGRAAAGNSLAQAQQRGQAGHQPPVLADGADRQQHARHVGLARRGVVPQGQDLAWAADG